MATNPGGLEEHAEDRPLAARLPRCRAAQRQNGHDVSPARRHLFKLSPPSPNAIPLTLFAVLLLISCGSEETGPGPTTEPDEPRPGAEETRQQEPRTGTATATPAPTRAKSTLPASRSSPTAPPAVTGPTPGPTLGTATAVRPTRIPPSQTSQVTELAVLRSLLDYIPNLELVSNWFDDDTKFQRLTGVEVGGPNPGRVVGLTMPSGAEGQVPPNLASLDRLEVLDLTHASFTGELPPELGQLPNIRVLRTIGEPDGYTTLTGAILPELGNLLSLEELVLTDNQPTGSIPAELGSLTSFRELYINQNELTGCPPSSLRGQLDLDNSDLGGLWFC